MKRILQIGLSFEKGGIESFVMNYYRVIDRNKYQFDFINPYSQPLAYEDEILRLGGKIYKVHDFHNAPNEYKKELATIMSSYDIVHVHMLSAANIIPIKVAQSCNVRKIIAHSHSTNAVGFFRTILHAVFRKRVRKYANTFLTCSEEAGDWMFGSGVNYQVMKNAVALDMFSYNTSYRKTKRDEFGIDKGAIVYGSVGRLEYEKNQEFMLQLFKEILKRQENSYLIIVGEGIMRDRLESLAEELDIRSKVKLLGRRSDVNQLYSSMDVFLLPSLLEGFPFTLVEAQANGLKCYVSEGNVPAETRIINNVEFIKLNEGEKKWAEIICNSSITRDKDAIAKLRKAHFDINKEVVEMERIYDD